MKFTINQTDLLKGLTIGSRSLLSKSNLPILSNVLISAVGSELEIITTNLETATRVVLKANIEREGRVTLPGRAISEFVSQLDPKEVSLEKLGEEVQISSEGFSVRLNTIAPEEFPSIPKVEGGKTLKIGAEELAAGVNRVAFCAAIDESRPILTGMLCEVNKSNLEIVATDGFRLGFCKVKIEAAGDNNGLKIIIPSRAFVEASKIASELGLGEGEKAKHVQIVVADNLNQAVFKIDNVEFTTRLIEGVFPSWEKLIPTNFVTNATVSKGELVRVIKVASIFARDSGNIVKIKLESVGQKAFLSVSSTTAQMGSSESRSQIKLEGKGGEIAFNFRYILEALSTIDGEEVIFEMNESLNPGRLTSVDSNNSYFHVIMPVRLQN